MAFNSKHSRTGQVTAMPVDAEGVTDNVYRDKIIFYNTDDDLLGFVGVGEATMPVEPGTSVALETREAVQVRCEYDDPPVDELQTATISGTPNSGDLVWTFESEDTDPIAFDTTTADLQEAMEGLSTIGAGNIEVAGTPGTTYTFTFVGDLAATDVSLITVDDSDLDQGSVAVLETDAGSPGTGSVVFGWQEVYSGTV